MEKYSIIPVTFSKSDTELDQFIFLFKMIANQPLVRIGTVLLILQSSLPEGLIRATVLIIFVEE
jgi:proline dehydrogenase